MSCDSKSKRLNWGDQELHFSRAYGDFRGGRNGYLCHASKCITQKIVKTLILLTYPSHRDLLLALNCSYHAYNIYAPVPLRNDMALLLTWFNFKPIIDE